MRIGEAAPSSPSKLVARPSAVGRRARPLRRSGIALVGALIAIGIALRLTYYLLDPALSSDEAALALNLVNRSYSGIFGQLDFQQAAPVGFLVLQKLAIAAFGPSPYALRLLPLTAGITGLILFYPVAKRFAGERAAVLALALFSISDPLMTYAGTNKQYSVDVAVTLVLYAIVLALPKHVGAREALILTVSGTIALWLSHAAAFVLAAVAMVLLVEAVKARRPAEFGRISAAVGVWLGSLVVTYVLTHASIAQIQRSIGGSQPTLLGDSSQPGQPGLLQTYGGMARFLFGIPTLGHGIRTAIALVAIALAAAGLLALSRQGARGLALLLVPGALAFVAAGLDKYVLAPRTFLFLIPALVMLAARGVLYLTATKTRPATALGVAALAILLASGSYAVIDHLGPGSPRRADFVRALRYLTQNARSGDFLYVHSSAQLDFRYYLECGCFGTSDAARKARVLWPVRARTGDRAFMKPGSPRLVAGAYSWIPTSYGSEFAPLRGKERVWVLVIDPTFDSQRVLARFLRRHGRRQDIFPRFNPSPTASVAAGVPTQTAAVALYDLR
jgi:hypothetical protein